jgi:alpha-tubulin suppressor-like RCC1 family protein
MHIWALDWQRSHLLQPRPSVVGKGYFGRRYEFTPSISGGPFHGARCMSSPGDYVTVLLTWGDGSSGALGHGLTTNEILPRVVTALVPRRLHSVCCGGGATFVQAASGEVYSCGNSGYGLLGQGEIKGRVCVPRPVPGLHGQLPLACSDRHAAAVGASGEFLMWGEGGNGQLGTLAEAGSVLVPRASNDVAECARVTAATKTSLSMQEATAEDVGFCSAAYPIAAACGSFHTLVVAKSGALYSWGLEGSPQLGQGREVESNAADEQMNTDASTGRRSSISRAPTGLSLDMNVGGLAKETGDRVFAGADPAQIRCMPPGVPARVPVVRAVRYVAAGVGHSAALSAKGRLWMFGANGDGQLGMGNAGGEEHLPKRVPSLMSVKVDAVACGAFFTALIVDGGGLLTFGANECGQLGHGGTEPEMEPRLVSALVGNPVVAIACGAYHLAALTAAGGLQMCGRNGDGELGVGDVSGVPQPLPVELPMFGEAGVATISISCGFFHTAAVVRLQRSRLPQILGAHAAAALESAVTRPLPLPREADALLSPQQPSRSSLAGAAQTAGQSSLEMASRCRGSGELLPPARWDNAAGEVAAEGAQRVQQSPERARLFRAVQDRVAKVADPGHRMRSLDVELDMLHARLSARVKDRLTAGQAFQMGRSKSVFVSAARGLIQQAETGVNRRASDQSGRPTKRGSVVSSPLPGVPRRPAQAESVVRPPSIPSSRSTTRNSSLTSRRGSSNTNSLHGSASQPVLSTFSLAAGRASSRGSLRGPKGSGEAAPAPVHTLLVGTMDHKVCG